MFVIQTNPNCIIGRKCLQDRTSGWRRPSPVVRMRVRTTLATQHRTTATLTKYYWRHPEVADLDAKKRYEVFGGIDSQEYMLKKKTNTMLKDIVVGSEFYGIVCVSMEF